jgi:hypothetical protein
MNYVREKQPSLAPATISKITTVFRRVMKVAQSEGAILDIPNTPKIVKIKDNPRPYFKFTEGNNEYQALLNESEKMAKDGVVVRRIKVSEELRDFILFVVHSFCRPTEGEVYGLKHKDIKVADQPKRLILTFAKGKTGFRTSTTMPGAVSVYQRILARNPEHTKDDYIIFPQYANRTTAKRTIMRQFNVLLERTGLKEQGHSAYSSRHTAICMRIVKSGGKMNIFNLARAAGTSVEQIERFYAKNLEVSSELAKNLQTFGGEE